MPHSDMSNQISQFILIYLRKNLDVEFYASDFSQEHLDTLMKELFEHFSKEKTMSRMTTIRTAIQDHFLDFSQECEVSIVDGKIEVKQKLQEGVKSKDEDKAFISMHNSLKKLKEQREEYQLQSYLLSYPQDILEGLYNNFASMSYAQDLTQLRNILRQHLEEEFELQTRDIILFLRKKLYVRYFVDMRVTAKGENRRFEGMDSEALEVVYQKNFPDNFEDILLEMAPDVILDALDFSRIDNFAFKAKYIEVFRTLVDVAMAEYLEGVDEEVVRALNGYILRLHFDTLLYLCAQILIEKVMQRDRKADEFLRFYNGETIINKSGNNIKKPFVEDIKGNRWNYNSIFSIMTQCIQYDVQYTQQVKLLKEMKEQHEKAHNLSETCAHEYKACTEVLSVINSELRVCTQAKELYLKMKNPSKQEKEKLLLQKQAEKRLLEKHDKSFAQKNELGLKLENAKISEKSRLKQFEAGTKSLKALEKKGEDLHDQEDNIFTALAKALTFR